MKPTLLLAPCLFFLCSPTASSLQDTVGIRPTVQALHASEQIETDGVLSEEVWQGPGITGFTQRDPDEGAPESERSVVWVAYDDYALYVAARLYDSAPDSIVSRLGRRDSGMDSDWFYFAVDPYHDRRTGFYFGVTPAGSIEDGTAYNDDWTDDSWDGVWDVGTKIDSEGWVVEMRVPYSQLRFHKQKEYVWGINFMRFIQRKNEENWFVMVPKKESGFVSRFADLIGIRDISPARRVEVLPYVVSSGHFLQHEAGDPFNDGSELYGDIGADLKIGIGSNLTLDATINPDFGQVEVDPAIVNLSQYETFFREKRPFFIEGASIFRFGQGGASSFWSFNWSNPNFFYSRRIGRSPQGSVIHSGFSDIPDRTTILGAAKLSGKISDWSIGALSALTQREFGRVDSSGVRFSDEIEPFTYYGVIRTRREFEEGRHAVGFIGASVLRDLRAPPLTERLSRRAYALGLDGWTFLDSDRRWVISGWTGATRVEGDRERILALQRAPQHYFQRPDAGHVEIDSSATSLSGYGARVYLNKQKGNIQLNAAAGIISPGLETNDLGFHWRGDLLNAHIVSGYEWYEPGRVFRRKWFNVATYRSYNLDGKKTGEGYFLFYDAQFLNYWGFGGNFVWNPTTLDDRRTRGGPLTEDPSGWSASLFGYTDSRKQLEGQVWMNGGRDIAGSRWWSVGTWMEWEPSSRVKVRFGPEFSRKHLVAQWVTRVEDPSVISTFGTRYIFATLDQKEVSASIRLDWTFTPTLSLQVYLQPLISSGDYRGFKEFARPESFDFNIYGEKGSTITAAGGEYTVDPDGAGGASSFSFGDPDFNIKSLRGNAVLRWEYLPGSVLYLVWTQDRTNYDDPGTFEFGRDFRSLVSAKANNIFLIKLTYWWSL